MREYKNCPQLNTEFGTDDNTEQFKLHTTDSHKRKRIITRRKFYKKDSSIDILTQYTIFLITSCFFFWLRGCLNFAVSTTSNSLAIMLWSLSSQGRRGIRISSIRDTILTSPTGYGTPFYAVIRGMRRSSYSRGKGSTFISQLIKTLSISPAPEIAYRPATSRSAVKRSTWQI